NGDGRLDLAVSDPWGVGTLSVLLGNGDGTFQPQVINSVGGGPSSIVTGEFDGDGRTDLAVSNQDWGAGGEVGLIELLGNGDGTFQAQPQIPIGYSESTLANPIAAGDFNGDGHTDLALASGLSSTVPVLLNRGDGRYFDPGQIVAKPRSTPLLTDV